ncbi:MAG TPA: hypothetical protein VG096_00500, partial [Bryobacteraceae bacterium]|nr:hypothetical protein [Bryobacteraceae bacterium]
MTPDRLTKLTFTQPYRRLTIWVDQVLQYHDHEIRLMLRYRLLEKTWDQIGKLLGMSGGQA